MDYSFVFLIMMCFTVLLAGLLTGLFTGFYFGIRKKGRKKVRKKRVTRCKKGWINKTKKKNRKRVKHKKGILSKRVHENESYVGFLFDDDKQAASDYICEARKTQEKSYKRTVK